MSAVREFFERIKQESGAELSRLGTQGSAELAGALFNGHAYVPYGPGQSASEPEHGVAAPEPAPEPQVEPEMERGGREM